MCDSLPTSSRAVTSAVGLQLAATRRANRACVRGARAIGAPVALRATSRTSNLCNTPFSKLSPIKCLIRALIGDIKS